MSTTTYTAADRGKLVIVEANNSTRVYAKPEVTAKSEEFIDGPKTAGTATGNRVTEGTLTFLEFIRGTTLLSPIGVSFAYVISDSVTLEVNPAYNPTEDLDRPGEPEKQTTTINTNKPGDGKTTTDYDTGETGPIIITKTPSSLVDDEPTVDPSKKWLTYGLYAVLGIAAITLIIILVQQFKKPKLAKA